MATKNQPASTERYYYADGRKVPLNVSARFLAIRGAGEGSTARSVAAGIAERLSTMSAPAQVLEVPEYSLTVIALPPTTAGAAVAKAGEAGLETLRAMVAAEPGVTTGPQVYEPATEDAEVALVPVGEILVKFKADAGKEAQRKLLDKYNLEVKQHDYPEPGVDLVVAKGDLDILGIANALQENALVEFAQPNFVHLAPRLGEALMNGVSMRAPQTMEALDRAALQPTEAEGTLAGPATPSDPGFASQWNLRKIKAPEAWEISPGSPGISIAILDEGCDMTHEDIVYKLPGYDAFAGDDNPQPDGNDAHGTACAGVAAMPINGKGGVGVAPGCKIVGIRIAKGVGGGFWSTTDAKVADGIYKAVQAPRSADVLSNSYSVSPSTVVTNAFKYAQTHGRGGKGCPIAAAAGNSNAPPVIYPARLSPTIPGFMAVSATNEWDQRKSKTSLDGETWWGSSYGPEVDCAAPGVHIYAPDITGAAGYSSGKYVSNFNGTSSATPHVAGLMALILSVDPELRSWEVEEIIKLTADDLGPAGRDPEFGFGRINCRRALEAASKIWYAITVNPVFLGAGKECFMRINVRMYNPGINTVRLDALTVTSHNPTWTAEIDRFEYRPNPGNVLAPRTNQDVQFNGILLKANGNQSSWSYRWALNWSYTFWRPSAPGLPLTAAASADESSGVRVTAGAVKGGHDGATPAGAEARASRHLAPLSEDQQGDSITVDRQTRQITIVVR